MIRQIPNFLSDKTFESLLEHRRTAAFQDVVNPADGVQYPRICDDVPETVRKEVAFLAGKEPNYLFLRESPAGVHVPHQAHTDNSMGNTSLMLYLEDGPGGTSFLRHAVLGVCYAPAVQHLVDLCMEDTNRKDAWVIDRFCQQERNKACIFDAGYFHRAEPIGGYGEGNKSRCVLTGFFE